MKLSVQCYTLRDTFARDVWGTFEALKQIGLDHVELAGTYGLSAQDLKQGLDRIGLKVSGAHIGLGDLKGNLDQVIEDCKVLGNPYVILPWVGEDSYAKGWGAFAKELEPIAARLADSGIGFAYHNHAFEFAEQNGKIGLDAFYEEGDPKLIKAQIDTYWVQFGGQDPASYIKKLSGRIPLVHFKDGKIGGEPNYLEAGQGDLDMPGIVAAAKQSGVEFGAIELDVCPREPLESVRISYEYLMSIGAEA